MQRLIMTRDHGRRETGSGRKKKCEYLATVRDESAIERRVGDQMALPIPSSC